MRFHEFNNEDYHPNSKPRGPEFKPTMPKGTVKVDVSDVYDWYKLGQHISNMKGLGKHDFGKGPPSTILSFGDEDTEHKYIQDLMKTGLSTTDIDPASHKKIKGQKVDKTYNVNESNVYIGQQNDGGSIEGYVVDTDKPQVVNYLTSQGASEKLISTILKKYNRIGIVRNMFVDEEYRNKGIGTELLSNAIDKAFLNDAEAILLVSDAEEENDFDLTKWYEGFGFEVIGTGHNNPIMMLYGDETLNEGASGYIPSNAEIDDPRFKTALTVDVRPDTMKKDAAKFGNKISRAGIPPTLKPNGKF